MDLRFLGDKIIVGLGRLENIEKLYEIRIRVGYGVRIIYDFKKYYLSENGPTIFENNAITINETDVQKIISSLTDKSFYAFNDRIKQGFLTSEDGIRVGLCGECVFDKEIVTIKNITSLNVRIPHEIIGASKYCFPIIASENMIKNSLIVSPPFCGKTTILKDLARRINREMDYNILLIDERGEFSNVCGTNIDSIKYSDKFYAFSCALRSMSPEIVITDELCNERDWELIKSAIDCGVKIIASCHSERIDELQSKRFFLKGLFDRFVFLESKKELIGKVKCVYDKDLNKICYI